MRRHSMLVILGAMMLLAIAGCAIAQDAAPLPANAPPGVAVPDVHCGVGFISVVLSGGPLGLSLWLAIFFWAILFLPLGLLSIIHCATARSVRVPLATKLLACGALCVFVLGWLGCAQGLISAFGNMAVMGSALISILAMNISHALYSTAAALSLCHLYLFFFVISLTIVHFKHKRILREP